MRPKREGFTLVELLVVIAIIGILVTLLLPAVQASREAARRSSCLNNMKQLMLGFHSHLAIKKAFPAARVNTMGKQRGWIVDLLPYIEEESLSGIYRLDKDFHAAENESPGKTVITIAACPSAPHSTGERIFPLTAAGGMPFGTQGASADYSVAYLLNAVSASSTGAAYNSSNLAPVLYAGPGEDNLPHPIKKITDGMSHTALICEQTGRPEHYVFRSKQPTNAKLQFANWWMAWASQRVLAYQGYDGNGRDVGAVWAVNCNNSQGIYSFHARGANLSFCDGSVRFINENVPVRLMFAFLTRDAGEVVSADQGN